MSRVIALTGGIASGKSTIGEYLKSKGAYVIDADSIVRELQAHGGVLWRAIAAEFGEDYLLENGELDRAKLGAFVFSDGEARQRLNGLTHPAVYAEISSRIERAKAKGEALIVAEIPLLIESGGQDMFEEIWLACADETVRAKRLANRSGLSFEQAGLRIASQLSDEAKRPYATEIIDTDMDLSCLYRRIDEIIERKPDEED